MTYLTTISVSSLRAYRILSEGDPGVWFLLESIVFARNSRKAQQLVSEDLSSDFKVNWIRPKEKKSPYTDGNLTEEMKSKLRYNIPFILLKPSKLYRKDQNE